MNLEGSINLGPDPNSLHDEILGAFKGEIQPVRAPLAYRFGLVLVAMVMVLLPVLYVAIIVLVAFLVYLHLVTNTGLLTLGRGRSALFFILVYFAPLIIGAILVLFMFKPLLSRPPRRTALKSLKPEEEPLLWAFVERICLLLRAPVPRRIEADWQVNASASFRRGLLSMWGDDLVLTIGMPLAAGLNMRQFAGVLAHEFGHFSQGGAMRLTYIIRSINHWFERVVYERDEWDMTIVRWSKQLDIRLGWIAYLARFFVWLTRRILWGLMLIGHGVSSFMLRQMEFDADRNQARLVGSDTFEATMRRLAPLQLAFQAAQGNLGDFYREGRLGDNLPQLVNHNLNQFTPEVHAKIEKVTDEKSTGIFDTHPATAERIARAHQEDAAGIFQLELSTSLLFKDFEAQCEDVTWVLYQHLFGEELERGRLFPIEELLERREAEQVAFGALNRYLQGNYVADRSLPLPEQPDVTGDPANLIAEIDDRRRQIVAGAPQYKATYERYAKVAWKGREQLAPTLAAYEALVGQRLAATLALAGMTNTSEDPSAWQSLKAMEEILPVVRLLEGNLATLVEMRDENLRLVDLFHTLSQNRDDRDLIALLLRQTATVHQLLTNQRRLLNTAEYPFDHYDRQLSLGEFALAALPDVSNPFTVLNAANDLFGNINRLRARVLGQLFLEAENIEQSLGLMPLPEPIAEEKADQ